MEKGVLIGQGRTAEVYAWGTDRILKLYEAHMPARAVQQEYTLTRAAQLAGIPVPAADQLVEIDGRRGIVFERLQGPSMLKTLADRPWTLLASARQLAELHAKIHAHQVSKVLPSQKRQIEDGILASKGLPENMRETARARLTGLPDGNCLCHGDFHPDNILITSHGPVIIDWMTATRGNPLADVCRTVMIFQTTGLPPSAPAQLRLLLSGFRYLIVSVYLNRYLQIHPAPRSDIDAWQVPLMAARLREVESYPKEKQLVLARISAKLK